jgi:hypothetical protein
MKLKPRLFVPFLVISVLFAPRLRAQGNPPNDPDLKKMMEEAEDMQKEANELNKKNPPPPDAKKKLAEMAAQAKAEEARQEQEEKRENEKLQAALKRQLEAPGPLALPDWTPATPQFTAKGSPAKKIVNDEVRIIQTGTSTLTPNELLDAWKASVADKPLNNVSNNIRSNGSVTTRLYVSTRTDSEEKVTLEASREAGGKITRVEIYTALPKPNIDSE